MTPGDLARFAIRALRGHRLRTALSVLGVTIGVASVILLTSLGEGARRYVVEEFSTLGTNLIIVLRGKTETTGMAPLFGGAPRDLTLEDVEALERRIPEIRDLAPLTIGEARVRFSERSRRITVAGTTARFQSVRKIQMLSGSYLPAGHPDQAPRVCVIGAKVYRELFSELNPLGKFLRIGPERYRVIGVMAPRGLSLGLDLDDMVHVPVRHAMRMFDQTSLFRILIEVRSHEAIDGVRQRVRAVLTERHGAEDVTVWTQDSVLASFGRILATLTMALGGIAGISLAVAGIGIMNVMLVSVSERVGEIGLLKALGASPGQILWAFLVEASVLSAAGGACGLALGFAGGALLRTLYPVFPAQSPTWAVVAAAALSLVWGLLFGALPARSAARLDPVQALSRR